MAFTRRHVSNVFYCIAFGLKGLSYCVCAGFPWDTSDDNSENFFLRVDYFKWDLFVAQEFQEVRVVSPGTSIDCCTYFIQYTGNT